MVGSLITRPASLYPAPEPSTTPNHGGEIVKKGVIIILTVAALILTGIIVWQFISALAYKEKVDELNEVVIKKDKHIQDLQAQLLPFKEIALEVYSTPEESALRSLSNKIQRTLEEEKMAPIYKEMSMWDSDGDRIGSSHSRTPVNDWMVGHIEMEDGKPINYCKDESLLYYESIINKYPHYPFPYYYLASCLLKKGDSSYREYAMRCAQITYHTTQVQGHARSHDKLHHDCNILLK